MTKITAVEPRGDCPLFHSFLDSDHGRRQSLVAYLQRMFGYCLTGDTSEQAIFFNHGGGQNGKTVLMSTVSRHPRRLLPRDAHRNLHREQERPTPDRACTAARRSTGHRHRDRGWPALGGKPPQGIDRRREHPARFMHKDFFEYLPQFKPVISGNHKPRLRSVGTAMRRRLNMIPFIGDDPQGRARHPARREAQGRMAGDFAMDGRWLPRLAGNGPRPA